MPACVPSGLRARLRALTRRICKSCIARHVAAAGSRLFSCPAPSAGGILRARRRQEAFYLSSVSGGGRPPRSFGWGATTALAGAWSHPCSHRHTTASLKPSRKGDARSAWPRCPCQGHARPHAWLRRHREPGVLMAGRDLPGGGAGQAGRPPGREPVSDSPLGPQAAATKPIRQGGSLERKAPACFGEWNTGFQFYARRSDANARERATSVFAMVSRSAVSLRRKRRVSQTTKLRPFGPGDGECEPP